MYGLPPSGMFGFRFGDIFGLNAGLAMVLFDAPPLFLLLLPLTSAFPEVERVEFIGELIPDAGVFNPKPACCDVGPPNGEP
jgi:hypothetical protein